MKKINLLMFRQIRSSISRFLAICAICALGAGFLFGLKSTTPMMKETGDRYFDRSSLMDFRLVSTAGITQEDIDVLRRLDCVEKIMPAYSADVLADNAYGQSVVRVHSMDFTNGINLPVLKEGRWPEGPDECVADSGTGMSQGAGLGDKITLSEENGLETGGLEQKEFTVTGIVDWPYYLSMERGSSSIGDGSVDYFILTLPEAFNSEYYHEAFVAVKGARELLCYEQEYETLISAAQKELEQALEPLAQRRYDQLQELYSQYELLMETNPEAAAQLGSISPPEMPRWYALSRQSLAGYVGFGQDADRVDAIAAVFPWFFFLVAALVCLTTMTRMVEEERTQIGVLKALGYGGLRIAFNYLFYAAFACVLGCAAGCALGVIALPRAIWSAYDILYTLPGLEIIFYPGYAVLACALSLVCTLAAALGASLNELRSVPASLIRPKAPPAGKRVFLERIGFIWKRLSFTKKVTARNLLRYKKRFFMTVIGIGGCTALLLTGFGLRDSIMSIVPKQFNQIQVYDFSLSLESPSEAGAESELNSRLKEYADKYMYIMQSSVDAQSAQGSLNAYLTVAQSDSLTDFIALRERRSGREIAFSVTEGVVVTEKLASELGLKEGDALTLSQGGADIYETTVKGIAENYVYNYIYMPCAEYERLFKSQPQFNTVMCALRAGETLDEEAEDAFSEELLKIENVQGVSFITRIERDFGDVMNGLNSVVVVLIICASLLAFVVLYNLTNINITERKREIATLKVLGFYPRETANYVFRENIILTLIGILLGLIFGVFLHQFVVVTAEVDMVMFDRNISFWSYVWSALMTLGFSFLVSLAMRKRISSIDMVESLKSVE